MHTRQGRNETDPIEECGQLSIFKHPGHHIGQMDNRILNEEEYNAAHLYALLNTDEIVPYIE